MKSFEYLVVAMNANIFESTSIQEELNNVGKKGWELVAVANGNHYLKREKPSDGNFLVEAINSNQPKLGEVVALN
jgi:hypothetical protein